MNIYKYLLISVIFAAPFFVFGGNGAEVYFRHIPAVAPESKFSVGVFVDSAQPVNAFEIEVGYPSDFLEFISFNTGRSIIDVWQKNPEVAGGVIKIQGGRMEPFTGDAGEIATVYFKAKKEGQAGLVFQTANLYAADGLGTRVGANRATSAIEISSKASLINEVDRADLSAPVVIKAEVVKNPFGNSRLAVFQAVDNESGIKETFLRSRVWLGWEDWRKASNPAPLPGGAWAFQIKAVDNQGNASEHIAFIWDEAVKKLLYLGIIAAILCLIYAQRRRVKLL